MAKHYRQTNTAARRVAAGVAAVATSSMLVPGVANAVTLPSTGIDAVDKYVSQAEDLANGVLGAATGSSAEVIPNLNDLSSNLAPSQSVPVAAVENVALSTPSFSSSNSVGQQIVAHARSKIGAPYVWGAAGPDSFDCSGLTSWAYSQVGKSIPRTSYAQAAQGQQVSQSAMQPGDIIVYYSEASHVGIYAGNGMMIDALGAGAPVGERPVNYMPIHSVVRF